jgi:hypothetical protein
VGVALEVVAALGLEHATSSRLAASSTAGTVRFLCVML